MLLFYYKYFQLRQFLESKNRERNISEIFFFRTTFLYNRSVTFTDDYYHNNLVKRFLKFFWCLLCPLYIVMMLFCVSLLVTVNDFKICFGLLLAFSRLLRTYVARCRSLQKIHKKTVIYLINSFQANVPFPYPLKLSGNL